MVNSFMGLDQETKTVKNIPYRDYVETCRLNGFEYVVIGRMNYIPIIDFFEMRFGTIAIPCRNRENGRNVIRDFIDGGGYGHLYIRKMIFPEDTFLSRIRKFIMRYDVVSVKANRK